jgi:serine/threonine protein kinase/tetratricopeptide (TPR) repeat protein
MSAQRRDERAAHADSRLAAIFDRLTDQLQRGAEVDVESLTQAHPAYADELRRFVPAIEGLVGLGRRNSPSPLADGSTRELPGQLGDFRIVREIGRGGMGVVYESQQLSLDRRVALKVLPMAGILDPRQLQRFKNEAQAAAQLQHPHIVPVYAVGCERGVHYYAMQYIDGRSLADVLDDLRSGQHEGRKSPSDPLTEADPPQRLPRTTAIEALSTAPATKDAEFFVTVARWGLQAAGALAHAHERGVLHRDVKPGNVLLDERGDVWIADFGLAQVETGTHLTRTGDVPGTLRYMSPEQALGKRALVDHRTDIYSLGATLYELATLEPVFSGRDREELLREIAFDDPLPPRRWNKAIPSDLETILLKALEKQPSDRYATAEELADDLQRFVDDRPIQARRPNLRERGVRWLRRHKPLAVSGLVLLAASVVVLAASTIWIAGERDAARTAAANARLQAEIAYQARVQADRQRELAEHNVRLAIAALDAIYLRLADERMSRDERPAQDDDDMLHKALAFFIEFAKENEASPQVKHEVAQAYFRIGDIQSRLGRNHETREAYVRGIALAGELAAELPHHPGQQYQLAEGKMRLGYQLRSFDDLRAAKENFDQAATILRRLVDSLPDDRECRSLLADAHNNQGLVLAALGRELDAEQAYRRAIALRNGPQSDHDARQARFDYLFSMIHMNLAYTLAQLGRLDEAENADRQAVALAEETVAMAPADSHYGDNLARCYNNLAHVMSRTGRLGDAESTYWRSLELRHKLADSFPNVPSYRSELAKVQNNLAGVLTDSGRFDLAGEAYREVVRNARTLVQTAPELPEYRHLLATGLSNLGTTANNSGRSSDAARAFSEAVALFEALGVESPGMPEYRWLLAQARSSLGMSQAGVGQMKQAQATHLAAIATLEALIADFPSVPDYQSSAGVLSAAHGAVLSRVDPAAARACLEAAIEYQAKALRSNPSHRGYRKHLGQHHGALALVWLAGNRHAEAAKVGERLAAVSADDFQNYLDAADILSACAADAELVAERLGLDHEEFSQAYHVRADAMLDAAAQCVPHQHDALTTLAWWLVSTSHVELRRADLAVASGRLAVEQAAGDARAWRALGAALYREGNWQEAIVALERALEFAGGSDGAARFFLAMAHFRHRDALAAADGYRNAVDWMETHQPNDAELRRFRAEAAQLFEPMGPLP